MSFFKKIASPPPPYRNKKIVNKEEVKQEYHDDGVLAQDKNTTTIPTVKKVGAYLIGCLIVLLMIPVSAFIAFVLTGIIDNSMAGFVIFIPLFGGVFISLGLFIIRSNNFQKIILLILIVSFIIISAPFLLKELTGCSKFFSKCTSLEKEIRKTIMDSDGDWVPDEEEVKYKTDLNNKDSDLDGIDDFAEIFIYKTNPIIADTDSDGHSDGNEINSSHNPNGDGNLKLFETPEFTLWYHYYYFKNNNDLFNKATHYSDDFVTDILIKEFNINLATYKKIFYDISKKSRSRPSAFFDIEILDRKIIDENNVMFSYVVTTFNPLLPIKKCSSCYGGPYEVMANEDIAFFKKIDDEWLIDVYAEIVNLRDDENSSRWNQWKSEIEDLVNFYNI